MSCITDINFELNSYGTAQLLCQYRKIEDGGLAYYYFILASLKLYLRNSFPQFFVEKKLFLALIGTVVEKF